MPEAATWLAGSRRFDLTGGMIVGILNVTHDSFSDGGDYVEPDAAVTRGLELYEQGAWMVDVGGESTRPGARPVPEDEESDRVLPVVAGLASAGVPVSIDTSKPAVAARAVDAGADAVNDVTGFIDPDMVAVCAENDVGAIVVHMKGEPRTMQTDPQYDDVVREVGEFLIERADALESAGLPAEAIVIDPGFGFGKTVAHNLEILRGLSQVADLGFPVMLGTSRKSTLGALTGQSDPKSRDDATAVTTALGFERGARLFRVHNVVASRDALKIAAAIVGNQRWDAWQQD